MKSLSKESFNCIIIFVFVYLASFITSNISNSGGFIFGVVAPLGLLAFFRHPKVIIAYLIVLNIGLFDAASLPSFNLFEGKVYLSDVILAIALLLSLIRAFRRNKASMFVRNPVSILISFFFVFALISLYISFFEFNNNPSGVLGDFKDLLYYLMFFAVILFYQNEEEVKDLVMFICLLAALVFFALFLEYLTGYNLIYGKKEVPVRIGLLEYSGVKRTVLQCKDIAFFSVLYGIGILLGSREKLPTIEKVLLAIVIVGGTFSLLITFSRNIYVSLFFCLILLFFFSQAKIRLALAGTYIVTVIAAISIIVLTHPAFSKFYDALSDRVSSITARETYKKDFSLQWRYFENRKAIEAIGRHPFTGVGLGGKYHKEEAFPFARRYIHNGYLFLALKMGIQTLAVFLAISFLILFRGLTTSIRSNDQVTKAIVVAAGLAFFGLMISSLVRPNFANSNTVFFIGILWGISESIRTASMGQKAHSKRLGAMDDRKQS